MLRYLPDKFNKTEAKVARMRKSFNASFACVFGIFTEEGEDRKKKHSDQVELRRQMEQNHHNTDREHLGSTRSKWEKERQNQVAKNEIVQIHTNACVSH